MLDDADPFHPCNHTRNNEGSKSSKLTVRSHEHHPSILSLIPPTQTQPDILPPPHFYLSFIAKNFAFIITLVLSRWCSLIVFDRTLSISLQELRFLLTSSFELAARRSEKTIFRLSLETHFDNQPTSWVQDAPSHTGCNFAPPHLDKVHLKLR